MAYMSNISGSETVAVLGVIAPGSLAAQAHDSGWIAMRGFESVLVIINAGTLGAAATLDAKIQQATSAAGAGAKDVAGKAITQLTKANNDDNKQVLINIRQQELDVKNGFRFIRVLLTVGEAASAASAVVLGLGPRYGPARLGNAAAVSQIVK